MRDTDGPDNVSGYFYLRDSEGEEQEYTYKARIYWRGEYFEFEDLEIDGVEVKEPKCLDLKTLLEIRSNILRWR